MTTTITIEAHCAGNTEVEIIAVGGGSPTATKIQDGETHIEYAYDDRKITVRELKK